jgi:phosphoribosylformylglycinamidine synthase
MSDIHEIRVFGEHDPTADAIQKQAEAMLGINIALTTARVFRVEGVDSEEATKLAEKLFSDPLTQDIEIGDRQDWDNSKTVEVAPLIGMMNPEAESIIYGAELLGVRPAAVDSSTEYRFTDRTSDTVISEVIRRVAMNEKVERIMVDTPDTLQITGKVGPIEIVPLCDLDDSGLASLSEDRSLFLDIEELKGAQAYFKGKGREPRDAELETLGSHWSEHCGHKTFNAKIFKDGFEKSPLFPRLKNKSEEYFDDEIVSAFHDNAGVFLFYDGMCINIKLETHNSPSALDPYGGSMTGSGGVFRDGIGTGLGAKVILSIDIFCFADPHLDKEKLPETCLDPMYLQQRVIDGVRDYGNRMGIPTANGSIHYDDDFRAKPTVMVGELAIQPLELAKKGAPVHGDLVVTMGGKTGRDGIHGATFSSGDMTNETATIHSSAVQIGNAIEEKKLQDAILEAGQTGCMRALTDCGAAGFASAITEMGSDIGVEVDISKAPLKYNGMAPWEIWMSESQERMIAAVIPEKYEEFAKICAKHGCEIAALGTFGTPEGQEPTLHVTYGDEELIELEYDFLENGLAQRELAANWQRPEIEEIDVPVTDWDKTIKKILSHGNVCSKEKVVRQYDHEVQGGVIIKPYGGVHRDAPNDAVVLQPIASKPYGLVQAHGMNPVLNNIDPYWGSVWAFAEGMSNYVAAGGNPDKAVLTNNYVTATPDEHVMGALDMMVDAVCDSMDAIKRPVISGKDSLSSRFKRKNTAGEVVETIDIPPVLTMTVAGRIDDISKTITTDIKKPGSTLVMVGRADYEALGGSILYKTHDGSSANLPKVDLKQLPKTLRGVYDAIQTNKVLACHDISEGGLAVAVSEMAFGGDCGVELNILGDISIKTAFGYRKRNPFQGLRAGVVHLFELTNIKCLHR